MRVNNNFLFHPHTTGFRSVYVFCVMECADVSLDTDRALERTTVPIIKQHAPCEL